VQFKGRTWKFGSNIDTDVIIPARYLTRHDAESLARHAMEGVDPEFSRKCAPGDILVAEWNFGCGSSREHAPIALAGAGIRCVLAKSFARIFYRNGFNMGLPLLEVSEEIVDGIEGGDTLEVDIGSGILMNHTKETRFQLLPVPSFMMDLLAAGGLIPYVRQKRIQQGDLPSR
jgi:3-isopropylmalate/(R)-2-methylmalate dehydratase small subunit